MSDPFERFAWTPDTRLTVTQCAFCRHKHTTGATCSAFPDGIPDEILYNEHDHRQPWPGDHGIRFEPLPGERHPNEGES